MSQRSQLLTPCVSDAIERLTKQYIKNPCSLVSKGEGKEEGEGVREEEREARGKGGREGREGGREGGRKKEIE